MQRIAISLCSMLSVGGLLCVSSCDSSEQRHCYDCGPCYADRCPQPPPSNGMGGASVFDGAGGLQLNLGSAGESSGGVPNAAGEGGTGETSAAGESSTRP